MNQMRKVFATTRNSKPEQSTWFIFLFVLGDWRVINKYEWISDCKKVAGSLSTKFHDSFSFNVALYPIFPILECCLQSANNVCYECPPDYEMWNGMTWILLWNWQTIFWRSTSQSFTWADVNINKNPLVLVPPSYLFLSYVSYSICMQKSITADYRYHRRFLLLR